MLGGHVQKAKRAGEKRGKGKERSDGGRGFKYSTAVDSAAVQPFLHRLPKQVSATGQSPAGVGAHLGMLKLARELDVW